MSMRDWLLSSVRRAGWLSAGLLALAAAAPAASAAAALAAAAAAAAGPAAAARPVIGPRLLLVQKDGRAALFLPESHVGSAAQDDAYFRSVIRPAFAASSALLAERSKVSWFDSTYYQSTCPDEGQAEAALDADLNAALRRNAPAVPPALRAVSPLDRLDTLGRFIRFHWLFVNAHKRAYGQLPDAASPARSFKIRNAQSGVLLAGAPRRADSVEDTGTWLHAYCAMPPAQRASLIADAIAQSLAPPDPADADRSPEQLRAATDRDTDTSYQRALDDLRATLRAPFPTGRADAPPPEAGNANFARAWTPAELTMNRFMIVERSQAWVAGLPAVLRRERLPFYALGAAHFADGPAGPGLITLLRDAGYSVSLLRDRRELDAALARLPAPAATARPDVAVAARPLSGGCQRDGGGYGCSWSDSASSYRVLQMPGVPRQEVWSACFEREGMLGPEQHCVSALRQAGAERAADLAGVADSATGPPPRPPDP